MHETKRRGGRDLSVVKVSAPYDTWGSKKRRKTETKKFEKLATLNGRLPPKQGCVRLNLGFGGSSGCELNLQKPKIRFETKFVTEKYGSGN